MKLTDMPEKAANKETSNIIWLFLPEGIVAILFLLAFPVQAVILFMHDRVGFGIFLLACAAASIYSSLKLMDAKKTYLALFIVYAYVAISLFIGLV